MILLLINVTIVSAIVAAAVLACRNLLRGAPARLAYVLVIAAFASSLLVPILAPRMAFVPARVVDRRPDARSSSSAAAHAIWIAGGALLGAMYTAAHIASLRSRRGWIRASDDLRKMLAWPNGGVLWESTDSSLATHGLLRPVVVANPSALESLDIDAARRLARHELAHVAWRDPLVKALARVACIAFWPAVPLWLLEREIRGLQEIACDESALRGSDQSSRASYASALLEVARHRVRGAAALASGDAGRFAARVALALEAPRRRPYAVAAAVTIVAASALVAAPAQLPTRVSVSIAPTANAPLAIEAAAMDIVAHTEAGGQPLALPDLTLRNDTDSAISAFAFTVWADGRFVGAIREEVRLRPRARMSFRQPYGAPPNLHIRSPRSDVRIELLKVEFANGRRWGFFGDPDRRW